MIINRDTLYKALSDVNRVINSRNTLPILACVVFKVEGEKLNLTAGDGEVFYSTVIDLVEGFDESFAVDCRTLTNALKEMPSMPLTINVVDNKIEVDYFKGKFELPTEDVNEYPTIPTVEGEQVLIEDTISINTAQIFVADDELRPVMNGVYLDFENGYIASSDGHKLYRSELTKADGSVIVPKKAMMLSKLLPMYKISFNDTNVMFGFEDTTIISRLIDGRYPNYNSVIPKNNPYHYEVDRELLINAIKRVSVFGSKASNLIRLEFKDGKLNLQAKDLDFSTSAEESLECVTSEDMTIGFKATFLIDILNSIRGDVVHIDLADKSRAGIFKGDNEDIFLLMPMLIE